MRIAILVSVALLSLSATAATSTGQNQFALNVPQGLPQMKIPKDNPLTASKVELGKQLFFDARLSKDNTVSCSSCHDPAKGWSNGEAFATGVRGQKGGRSAPSIVNAGYQYFQFWDGRALHVEGQALGPIENPIEMDMPPAELVTKLNKIEGYRKAFQEVFNADATKEGVAKAIGAFERTILSGDAPYDRFKAGDKSALSEAAEKGRKLFFGKAHCSACHSGPLFTDGAFHNIGVGMDNKDPDIGRQAISKLLGDRGSFKTPTLRDINRSAPYMHDGSLKSLEDVVNFYNQAGIANPQLDEEIEPLKLTDGQKADLIVFLKKGLASSKYPHVKPPQLPK